MSFFKWSKVAATNGSADPSCPFPEGMAPSAVNDGTRGMMAAAAKFRDDISGAIVTGGTSTAYTATSNQVFAALATDLNGQMLAFVPHATNTNAVGVDITLNFDGLGAKPVRAQPGVALPNGSLVLGTPYVVTYNHADAVFYLRGMTNPYQIPLAGGMDYWGSTAPNTSFAFPIGQQISQTTFAALYALFGPNKFGADGGGLFFLPDKRGRVSAAVDNGAGRLSTGSFAATLGAETRTLTTANLPAYTPSGAVATSISQNAAIMPIGAQVGSGPSAPNAQGAQTGGVVVGATSTFAGDAQGGTSTAFGIAQPTIVCNYIIRII